MRHARRGGEPSSQTAGCRRHEPPDGRLPPDMCVHLWVADEPALPDGDADGDAVEDTDAAVDAE